MDIESSIRPARNDDADAISQVILSALRETNARHYSTEIIARVAKGYSPTAVRKLINQREVFVAVLGPEIVGTASLDGKMIHAVFVSPNAQGQGVGRQLMAEVERVARRAGTNALVLQSSVTAEQFYARLGFKAVRDDYHGDERTIIMERHLAPI